MRNPLTRLLFKSVVAAAALLLLGAGSAATARDHSEAEALSAKACGMTGGALADPADTQACLAERYKAPKPKPPKAPAPPAPAKTASTASPGAPTGDPAAAATHSQGN